jgi:PST family polysaccharide transporter
MLLTRTGPRTVFLLAVASVLLTLPAFTLGLVFQGVNTAIVAWIASSTFMLFVGARVLLSDLGQSWMPLVKALIRPALGAMTMAAFLAVLDTMFSPSTRWVPDAVYLVASILLGAFVYISTVALLWLLAGRPREAETELFSVALGRFRKPR